MKISWTLNWLIGSLRHYSKKFKNLDLIGLGLSLCFCSLSKKNAKSLALVKKTKKFSLYFRTFPAIHMSKSPKNLLQPDLVMCSDPLSPGSFRQKNLLKIIAALKKKKLKWSIRAKNQKFVYKILFPHFLELLIST